MSPWMLGQIGWRALPSVILMVGLALLLVWIENVRLNKRWKREIQGGTYSSRLVKDRLQFLEREYSRLCASDVSKSETIKRQADVIAAMRSLLGVHDGSAAAGPVEKAGDGRGSDAAGRVPAARLDRRS